MSNKKRLGLGLIVILVITFGVFLILPRLIFSDDEELRKSITVTAEKLNMPDKHKTKHEPPKQAKQEIKQVLEYKWDLSLDSCNGRESYFWQIRFDPLPELNQPSKIYVKLKSCWERKTSPTGSHPIYKEGPYFTVKSDENSLDYTQVVEPRWLFPIKKGEIYEGSITIVPRDIGRYGICILGGIEICFNFGFNETGELVHLSDRGSFPISDLPNHPVITDKDIFVKFKGQYVTNLFHITPPLSLNDTSTVYYRVITKDYYPDGMKIVTRSYKKSSFKMLPGPITKGDTLEGSFKVVPPWLGGNSFVLDIEEPPREGFKPKNDSFMAYYHLDKDGKLLYIVRTQKESKIFYEYFKKQGVTVGEY